MAEIASAFVSIVPSMRGFEGALNNSVAPAVNKSGEKSGKSFGSKVTSFMGGMLKKGAIGVGAAAGGILGTALFSGFKRLNAIDQAKAKLTGLGNSTKTVNKIMGDARSAVLGTSFGLDEAATTAGMAVAAGIKPGKELQGVLSTTADVATIAGTSMSDMGKIFGSVAARGKLQGDDMMQLTSKGVPVLQYLAKHYGITAQAASEMVSKGQVDFKSFNAAMSENLGGAAKQGGKTFTGALSLLKSSLSRIGASLLGPFFEAAKKGMNKVTELLGPVETAVGKLSDKVGPAMDKLGRSLSSLGSGGAGKVLGFLVDSFKSFGKNIGSAAKTAAPAIGTIAKALAPLAKLAGGAWLVFMGVQLRAVGIAVNVVAKVFAVFVKVVSNPAVQAAIAAIGTGLAVAFAPAVARMVLFNAQMAITLARMVVVNVATKAWAAGQALLNAVMSANPIGLVVIAIAALVAGLVVAYKRSETFRAIVNAAFNGIKTVVVGVVNFIKPVVLAAFSAIATYIRTYMTIARTVLTAAWNVIKAVVRAGVATVRGVVAGISVVASIFRSAFNAAKTAVTAVFNVIKSVVRGGVNTVKTVIGGVSAVGGIIRRAFQAAVSAVGEKIGNVVSKVRELPGKIKDAFGKPLSILSGIGGDIVQGLVSGIGKAAGKVSEAVRKLVDKIPGPIKKIMGIKSPSRVMADIGRNIALGLAQGIESGQDDVARSMARIQATLTPGSPGATYGATAASGTAAGGSQQPVVVNVYPQRGQSEEEIGRIASARTVWAVRNLPA